MRRNPNPQVTETTSTTSDLSIWILYVDVKPSSTKLESSNTSKRISQINRTITIKPLLRKFNWTTRTLSLESYLASCKMDVNSNQSLRLDKLSASIMLKSAKSLSTSLKVKMFQSGPSMFVTTYRVVSKSKQSYNRKPRRVD